MIGTDPKLRLVEGVAPPTLSADQQELLDQVFTVPLGCVGDLTSGGLVSVGDSITFETTSPVVVDGGRFLAVGKLCIGEVMVRADVALLAPKWSNFFRRVFGRSPIAHLSFVPELRPAGYTSENQTST